jgi:hypothetical protein
MDRRPARAFLLLIAAQTAHSIEEYWFRLYDVLAPARAVSDALGIYRPAGFALANAALIGFGLWCYFARLRRGRPGSRGLAWFWAVLELSNGLAHGALALAAGGYFPGLATAPLLLAASAWLIACLRSDRGRSPAEPALTPAESAQD